MCMYVCLHVHVCVFVCVHYSPFFYWIRQSYAYANELYANQHDIRHICIWGYHIDDTVFCFVKVFLVGIQFTSLLLVGILLLPSMTAIRNIHSPRSEIWIESSEVWSWRWPLLTRRTSTQFSMRVTRSGGRLLRMRNGKTEVRLTVQHLEFL